MTDPTLVETRNTTVSIVGGIVVFTMKSGAEETLKDAEEALETMVRLLKGSRLPVLVDMSHIKAMSREARNHYMARGPAAGAVALALVVTSPISRVIGNFAIAASRPTMPARLFACRQDAIAWLEGFPH